MKPVCLVLGAGAGIGGTVAKKFAIEGYHSCLCRRSDQGAWINWYQALKKQAALQQAI